MTQEELAIKIKAKRKLIQKHSKELEVLKSLCTHSDYIQKEEYFEGGYDYYSETDYYKICNTCGKRFDLQTKTHSWR